MKETELESKETPEAGYIRKAGAAIEAMQEQAKAHQLLEAVTGLQKEGQIADIIYSLHDYQQLLNTPGVKITDRVIHLLDNGMKAFVVYEVAESEQQKPLPVESERQTSAVEEIDNHDGEYYRVVAADHKWLELWVFEQYFHLRLLHGTNIFNSRTKQSFALEKDSLPALIELLQHVQKTLQP